MRWMWQRQRAASRGDIDCVSESARTVMACAHTRTVVSGAFVRKNLGHLLPGVTPAAEVEVQRVEITLDCN